MDVLRTADVLRRYFSSVLEPYGVTGQQYNVLRILRGAPAGLQTMEIAERMIEKTPGITGLIDRLEEKGLIERERCEEDRRCVYCSITTKGRKLLAMLDEPIREADEDAMASLSESEAETLSRLLRAVRPTAS